MDEDEKWLLRWAGECWLDELATRVQDALVLRWKLEQILEEVTT